LSKEEIHDVRNEPKDIQENCAIRNPNKTADAE
jgi:hypothetical protein